MHATLSRTLWLLCALLVPSAAAQAQSASPHIYVPPIAGAERPFNETFAGHVAREAQALGLDASAKEWTPASLELVGTAKAFTTDKGAVLTMRWSLMDPTGAVLVAFTIQGTAPYRAKSAWEAIDGDTLRWFAAATARELDYAMESLALQAPPRIAGAEPNRAASLARSEPTGSVFTRVNLAGVKGASGDGNEALMRALARALQRNSIQLVADKEADAYVIEGHVTLKPQSATEDTVSILWVLADGRGRELARIEQTNAVPAGALHAQWGETAVLAAEGAAEGLIEVMSALGARPPGG